MALLSLPPTYEVETNQNLERACTGNASGLNRRTFLRLGAWFSTALMATTKAKVCQGKQPAQADGVEVVHTRVFAAGPNGGNPCPVIPFADRITDSQMQILARKFGLETAFILKPQSKTGDIRLRYFVPDHEMGVSGHATIAAITVAQLSHLLKSDHAQVETISGAFEVNLIQRKEGIVVTLEQNKPVFGKTVEPELVARALKIDSAQIVLDKAPIQAVSVSRAKLLVPLVDSNVLNTMQPDYEAVWQLCEKFHVTGFYPFTRQTDKPNAHAEARQFPLRAGFPEDAATGVAAAALGAYLATYDEKCQAGQQLFRIAQGYAMRTPSLIEAIADCAEGKVVRTAIRGSAQVVARESVPL